MKLLGLISVGFDITEQVLIRFSTVVRYWRESGSAMRIYQLFIGFKKVCDSMRREALYNVLIKFGVPVKLVKLLKMCLSETRSKVNMGKHLCDSFLIQNCLKHGNAL
jgi:hypothetical protein